MSDHVRVEGELVEVRRDPLDRFGRGAALVFFVAPGLTLAVHAGGAIFGASDASSSLAVVIAAGLAGAIPGLVGLGLLLASRASKPVAMLDLGERLLVRGGRTEVLREVEAVAVQRAGGWRRGFRLVLAGPHPVPLLSFVPASRGAALCESAERLADALDVPLAASDAALSARGWVPKSADAFAALCLLPVDGLSQAYAIWALVSSRDARVRRAAKQGLAATFVEVLLLGGLLGCAGVPILALADGPGLAHGFLVLFPALLFALARAGFRLHAAHRARRGEPFSLPGLGRVG